MLILASYLFPLFISSLALFTKTLNEGIFLYSLAIAVCFFFIHIFLNEINTRQAKHLLLAMFYLFLLDFAFSFPIGCNVLSFLLSLLFFYRIKQIYQEKIKPIYYIEYIFLFFIFENIINYIINKTFDVFIFSLQTLFSICLFMLYSKIVNLKRTEQQKIFEV